jgi:hypothetical protein
MFVPILQPLHYVHLVFGALRPGLHVRVLWRGKTRPTGESIIEIISDEDTALFSSGKKASESNEINTLPYKIFKGGRT